jgi:dienelactone hydrolase
MRALRATLALAASLLAAGCLPAVRQDRLVPDMLARRSHLVESSREAADTVDGHVIEPVRLRAASGLHVELLLKRPVGTGTAGVRVPVVVLLGGHHVGRQAANYIPDTGGRAVAALSYPYRGAHRLSAVGALRAAPTIRQAVLDTPPAVMLALDYLLAQPWADTARVEAVGASLGTSFMTVATALDPRITRLWSVHGAGDNERLLRHNTRPYVRLKPARSVAARFAGRVVAARALSPERWVARVAPRPFVMVNATEDERLPRSAIQALYDSARAPKELVWLPGKHVQRSRPEVLRALVATVLARMASPPEAARGAGTGGALQER